MALRAVRAADAGRVEQAQGLARLAEALARVGARLAPAPGRTGEENGRDDAWGPRPTPLDDEEDAEERLREGIDRRVLHWPVPPDAPPFAPGETTPEAPPCGRYCARTRLHAHIAARVRQDFVGRDLDAAPSDGETLMWMAMARSMGVVVGDAEIDRANAALAQPGWEESARMEGGRDSAGRLLPSLQPPEYEAACATARFPPQPTGTAYGPRLRRL